jgi:ankyrin repeat protein
MSIYLPLNRLNSPPQRHKQQTAVHFGMHSQVAPEPGTVATKENSTIPKIIHHLQQSVFNTIQASIAIVPRFFSSVPTPRELRAAIHANNPMKTQHVLDKIPPDQRLAVINYVHPLGYTALHQAIIKNNPAIVRMVLNAVSPTERATLVKQADNEGFTPFHWAVIADNSSILDSLINALPDPIELAETVNAVSKKQQTPLHLAAKYNKRHIMEELLVGGRAQASIHQADQDGLTPIQLVERATDSEGIKRIHVLEARLLVTYGANPNQLSAGFRNRAFPIGHQPIAHYAQQLANHPVVHAAPGA